MDINDVIIKFIVTYYCLSACSIHWYSEAIAHAWRKLKPCLLLSNCCHVEYINYCARSVSLSLSLKSWLTKSWVLFAILKLKVTYTQTDFSWLSPYCQQSRQGASDRLRLWSRDSVQTLLILSERLSQATLVMIGLCRPGAQISHTHSCCLWWR